MPPPPSPPPPNATVIGRIYSVRPEYGPTVNQDGATIIWATAEGSSTPVIATATTGGAFSISDLPPGRHTLTVYAAAPMQSASLRLVEAMTTEVDLPNHAITDVSIGVVVICDANCAAPTPQALIVMQWDATVVDSLGLGVTFDLPPEGENLQSTAHCQVSAARPACGEATWSESSDAWTCGAPTCTQTVLNTAAQGFSCNARILWEIYINNHPPLQACTNAASAFAECAPCMPLAGADTNPRSRSEVISINRWVEWLAPPGSPNAGLIHTPPYLGFLFSQPILCRGYGRPSSPSVAGGGNTVDCVGDCTTGRGYCYARSYQGERICANCVLWDPVGSEVLCDFPQGGPIPGTPEWAEGVRLEQCANRPASPPSLPGVAPPQSCASELLWRNANPKVSIISNDGTLVDSYTPPPGTGAGVSPSYPRNTASVACIQPAGSATRPIVHQMPFRLLDDAGFVSTREAAENCSHAAGLVTGMAPPPDASSGC